MKFIVLFLSFAVFAEPPSVGFGKERSPFASEQPTASPAAVPANQAPADAAPAVSDALDPIRMQFDELRTKYEKDSALAVKPVAEAYVRQLEALETQLADKRRFDDAEIVKKYVDYIKAKYIDQAMDVPQMPDISKIKELVELEKQFQAYSTKAIKPVVDAHVKKLDAESVKCARDKDYKNAKLFQEEIKRVNDSFASGGNVQAVFNPVGRWQCVSQTWGRIFFPNGVVKVWNSENNRISFSPDETWKLKGKTLEIFANGELVEKVQMINNDTLILEFTKIHENQKFLFRRMR